MATSSKKGDQKSFTRRKKMGMRKSGETSEDRRTEGERKGGPAKDQRTLTDGGKSQVARG